MITLLQLTIELCTPGGPRTPEVPAPGGGFQVPIARDGWGDPYIPATSLAGSLRACASSLSLDPAKLFGTAQDTITASPVRFLGTRVTLPENKTHTRTRTAIDRRRGAPMPGLLWSAESLPPGTRITCYLRLDQDQLLPELRTVLAAWQPHIGGGQTIGRGRAELTGVRMKQIDLTTPDGLRTWLTAGGPALFDDATPFDLGARPTAPSEALTWNLVIDGGLHIGTGHHDITADESAPALLARLGDTPYIPGSTWKGLLRSRCEYILRSLGKHACHSSDPDQRCSEPPVCPVCAAFGWTGHDDTAVGQRSLLWFPDTTITDARYETRQHVALDRVTGGARSGQLYATQIVSSGNITLTIELHGSINSLTRALLDLAVADIHDGHLGIGAATTRGLGRLRYADLGDDQTTAAKSDAALRLAKEVAIA